MCLALSFGIEKNPHAMQSAEIKFNLSKEIQIKEKLNKRI